MKKLFFTAIFIFTLIFTSCMTLQEDIRISTPEGEQATLILEIEKKVVEIDALSFDDKVNYQTCEKLLQEIQSALQDKNLSAASKAQLYALKGRVNIILSKESQGLADYNSAQKLYKGDVQSVILAFRLGKIDSLDSIPVVKSQKSLITLEKALQNYKDENYLQSLAYFDEAFISLDSFYKQQYLPLRNTAWKLRNTSSSSSQGNILKKDSITLGEMVNLMREESNIMYKYLGSRKVSDKEMVQRIKTAGLLASINGGDEKIEITESTVVTRELAARILWNIYNDRKGALKASAKYAPQFARSGSPIPDVDIKSADFDAIIGCIEKEIMELPNGNNFFPKKQITPLELNKSIKTIR